MYQSLKRCLVDVLGTRSQSSLLLSIAGGPIIALSSAYSVISTLDSLRQTPTANISLTDPMKMFISLHLFLGLTALAMALTSAFLVSRARQRAAMASSVAGILLGAGTFASPTLYGVPHQVSTVLGTGIGIALMSVATILAMRIPQKTEPARPFLGSVEVATVTTLSAVYAIAIVFTGQAFPSPTGGYLHFGDFVVFVAALIFGAKVGGLVGIVGAVVADFYLAYPRWYVTILAHGLEGVVPGFARRRNLLLQVVASGAGGFLMASTYFLVNVFLKGYPVAIISYVQDLFGQAAVSVAVGIPMAAIVRRALPRVR